jgi:hypothetical protein
LAIRIQDILGIVGKHRQTSAGYQQSYQQIARTGLNLKDPRETPRGDLGSFNPTLFSQFFAAEGGILWDVKGRSGPAWQGQ